MTEEPNKKRGVLVLSSDPSYDGPQQGFIEEDDAWRAFLENPLTVASKAMMSVNGDEDSANALGILYDYYKVPKDKRSAGHPKVEVQQGDADSDKISFTSPLQESPLAMTTLRNVPLSTVVHGVSGNLRKRTLYPGVDAIGSIPSYSGTMEGSPHPYPSLSHPGSHSDLMTFSRQLNHHQYGSRGQALTPDSSYTDSYKNESNEAFPLSEQLHLRMASIAPEDYSSSSTASSQHFEYILEAPQSLRPKNGSAQMSYLNKGQFYPISLRDLGGGKVPAHHSARARSVVMLVFGEEKFTEDQLKHWRYWHSRQHTAKQRCLDIDYKESFNTISNIEEIAYNAISFTWDTNGEGRIFVSVNCLSTDFSPQKGVRGLPLNLQIDTYSCGSHGDKLVHRAYSQIKVFCDKGAERKIRDEDRKQSRRKTKGLDSTLPSPRGIDASQGNPPHDFAVFKPVSDMGTEPVLFIPDVQYANIQRHTALSDDVEESLGQKKVLLHTEEDFDNSQNKRARRDEPEKVLLYVRKEAEEVFDALMLTTPTLSGLLEAVTEKYKLPIDKMGKVYKKCKKGILVHMDNNIIEHYSNEDAFQIHIEEVGGKVHLTLTEI